MELDSSPGNPLSQLSVLVSSYNKLNFLKQSEIFLSEIAALGAQVIIIEDSSSDGSTLVIGSWKAVLENSITFIVQSNAGSAVSRNVAISLADRKYLLFVDIDDFLDVKVLCEIFPKLLGSDADLGIAGYIQMPAKRIGPYPLDEFQNATTEVRDHRTELLEGVGWWRYFYKRSVVNQNSLKFIPTFEEMGGKVFVLDDLLWLLHIFSMDLTIYRAYNTEILYQYFLPDVSTNARREWYLEQVALMPTAIKLFLLDLQSHDCIHDEKWLYQKCLDLLWQHANFLDFFKFIITSHQFLSTSLRLEKIIGKYIFFETIKSASRTFLRLAVLQIRSVINPDPVLRA